MLKDLGKWLLANDLWMTARSHKKVWHVQLSRDGASWFGKAETLDNAVESALASFDLRYCDGFPLVREVDGTCR